MYKNMIKKITCLFLSIITFTVSNFTVNADGYNAHLSGELQYVGILHLDNGYEFIIQKSERDGYYYTNSDGNIEITYPSVDIKLTCISSVNNQNIGYLGSISEYNNIVTSALFEYSEEYKPSWAYEFYTDSDALFSIKECCGIGASYVIHIKFERNFLATGQNIRIFNIDSYIRIGSIFDETKNRNLTLKETELLESFISGSSDTIYIEDENSNTYTEDDLNLGDIDSNGKIEIQDCQILLMYYTENLTGNNTGSLKDFANRNS